MTDTNEQLRIVLDTARTYLSRNSSALVRSNADDLAQEVGINFLRASADEDIKNPAAWAITASKRLAINLIERNREDVAEPEDDTERAVTQFVMQGLMTSYMAIVRQQADLLMAQLTESEKEFVTLVAMGYSQAEIAEIVGLANANTVKATLNRKRRQLAEAAADAGLDVDWQDHPRAY